MTLKIFKQFMLLLYDLGASTCYVGKHPSQAAFMCFVVWGPRRDGKNDTGRTDAVLNTTLLEEGIVAVDVYDALSNIFRVGAKLPTRHCNGRYDMKNMNRERMVESIDAITMSVFSDNLAKGDTNDDKES